VPDNLSSNDLYTGTDYIWGKVIAFQVLNVLACILTSDYNAVLNSHTYNHSSLLWNV